MEVSDEVNTREGNIHDFPEPADNVTADAHGDLHECGASNEKRGSSQPNKEEEDSNLELQLRLMKSCVVVLNRQEVERYLAEEATSTPKLAKRRNQTLTSERETKRKKTEEFVPTSYCCSDFSKGVVQPRKSTTPGTENQQGSTLEDSIVEYQSPNYDDKTLGKNYPTIRKAIQVLARRLETDHICFYCLEHFLNAAILKQHMFNVHKVQKCGSCNTDYISDEIYSMCGLCLPSEEIVPVSENHTQTDSSNTPKHNASTSQKEYKNVRDESIKSSNVAPSNSNVQKVTKKLNFPSSFGVYKDTNAVKLSSAESSGGEEEIGVIEQLANTSKSQSKRAKISNVQNTCTSKTKKLTPLQLQKLCHKNSKYRSVSKIREFNVKTEYISGYVSQNSKRIYNRTVVLLNKIKSTHICVLCKNKQKFKDLQQHLLNYHKLCANECALVIKNCQRKVHKCYNCGIEFNVALLLVNHIITCTKNYGIIPSQIVDSTDNLLLEDNSKPTVANYICINCKTFCVASKITEHRQYCTSNLELDIATFHHPSVNPYYRFRCPICKNNCCTNSKEFNGHVLKCNAILGSMKGVLDLKLCNVNKFDVHLLTKNTNTVELKVTSINSTVGVITHENSTIPESTTSENIDQSNEGMHSPLQLQTLCDQNSKYDHISNIPEFNVVLQHIDGLLTEESKLIFETTLEINKQLKLEHKCCLCTRTVYTIHGHLSSLHRLYNNECVLNMKNCQANVQKCYNCSKEFINANELIKHIINCVKCYGIIPVLKLDSVNTSQVVDINNTSGSETTVVCINCKESCIKSNIDDHIINCSKQNKLDASTYYYPSNDPACKYRCPICKNNFCINNGEFNGHVLKCNAVLGSLKGVLDLKLCDMSEDSDNINEVSELKLPATSMSNATGAKKSTTIEKSNTSTQKQPVAGSSRDPQYSSVPSTQKQHKPSISKLMQQHSKSELSTTMTTKIHPKVSQAEKSKKVTVPKRECRTKKASKNSFEPNKNVQTPASTSKYEEDSDDESYYGDDYAWEYWNWDDYDSDFMTVQGNATYDVTPYDLYGDFRGTAQYPVAGTSRGKHDTYPDPSIPRKVCPCTTPHANINKLKPKTMTCPKCNNVYKSRIFKYHFRACRKKSADRKLCLPYGINKIIYCNYCQIHYADPDYDLHIKDCSISYNRKVNNTMLFLKLRDTDLKNLSYITHDLSKKLKMLLKNIILHFEVQHGITLIPMCPKCKCAFQFIDELLEHYVTHIEKFKCEAEIVYHIFPDKCHLEFTSVYNLLMHYRDKHNRNVTCGSCDHNKAQLVTYNNEVFTFLRDCPKCSRVTKYELCDGDVSSLCNMFNTDYVLYCEFCETQRTVEFFLKSSMMAQVNKYIELHLREIPKSKKNEIEKKIEVPYHALRKELTKKLTSNTLAHKDNKPTLCYPDNVIQSYGHDNSLESMLQNCDCSYCRTVLLNKYVEFNRVRCNLQSSRITPKLFLCVQCNCRLFPTLLDLLNHHNHTHYYPYLP